MNKSLDEKPGKNDQIIENIETPCKTFHKNQTKLKRSRIRKFYNVKLKEPIYLFFPNNLLKSLSQAKSLPKNWPIKGPHFNEKITCSRSKNLNLVTSYIKSYTSRLVNENYGSLRSRNSIRAISTLYNSTYPPEYNLHKIQIPIVFFYADSEWLTAPEDAQNLYSKLPRTYGLYRVNFTKFNHLDFLWGIDARQLLYNDIIDLINKYDNLLFLIIEISLLTVASLKFLYFYIFSNTLRTINLFTSDSVVIVKLAFNTQMNYNCYRTIIIMNNRCYRETFSLYDMIVLLKTSL
ncbi:Similar to Lipa: Lysosomal acid lipase/cholesteryl ester hydrolase (Rattus norvegicus) [Cotesia congregata]|uniref:Similar to Lipa: Lysosomal acid lipase/cholesteryl ester hydrolase (Rattus norvegicus) n=1 Tax=Cotesia congregata TaxID=51543 RepID=A0A8J2H5W2_COTCN|nr:Similar to Lipa: Lysosomal acid lipase/cholesteryl ester hydrolase (Rattus norvegicus) [Cotesia congregata]